MSRILALPGLDAARYERHSLHAEARQWVEKNCYVDIWIEVIHALALEPLAILPFASAIDFDGDQWTFFKPPHDELRDLYGIDVQELNVWQPLLVHAVEHLSSHRLISTEADAFWLPDTAGTDYRRQHTKTTIVLADLDVEAQRLGYFHNAGYYSLDGEDFERIFRVGVEPDPSFMPLFAETVRLDRLVRRSGTDLRDASRALWKRHLARLPADNPVERFRARFESDLPGMQQRGLAFYHAWAFATTRQLGSAFELAAQNLRWLDEGSSAELNASIECFEAISTLSKTFILKGARAVNSRRAFDAGETFSGLSEAWKRGTDSLVTVAHRW